MYLRNNSGTEDERLRVLQVYNFPHKTVHQEAHPYKTIDQYIANLQSDTYRQQGSYVVTSIPYKASAANLLSEKAVLIRFKRE